ncbi:MAG: glycosyltransferase family 4 protein [Bacilli bacterium]
MENLRIVIVTSGLVAIPITKGGAIESLITNLINMNEKERKFSFKVFTCFDKESQSFSKTYEYTDFIYYNKLHKNNLKYKLWAVIYYICRFVRIDIPKYHYIFEIYQKIKEMNFDYVIVEEGDPWAFNFIAKKIGRNKMIFHSHSELIVDNYFERNFEYIISCSRYISDFNVKNSKKYIDKSFTLLNCINEDLFSKRISYADSTKIKKRLEITNSDFVFLFIGRISQDKGVLELIKAWNNFPHSNMKLLIIGSALLSHETLTPYEELVKNEISISTNVIQTGYIPQKELYQYHQIADVFIAPSMREAAGLMNIEAMYSGLPIISVKNGGIPEYLDNNRNAILIDSYNDIVALSNAMLSLYQNQEMRKIISKNNFEDCEKFSIANYYKNFNNIMNIISNQKNQK